MSDIEQRAESVVSMFNDSVADYSPKIEWEAMSTGWQKDECFVFVAESYLDPDGLSALRKAELPIAYIEAYAYDDSVEIHMLIPVSEVPEP